MCFGGSQGVQDDDYGDVWVILCQVLFMIGFWTCHHVTWLYSGIILMYGMCAFIGGQGVPDAGYGDV